MQLGSSILRKQLNMMKVPLLWLKTEMAKVTMGTFKQFQLNIFPIIQAIISNHPKHPIVNKWSKAQQSRNKIDEHSTFRTISKALELKDLHAYLLNNLPDIDNYINLQDNGSSIPDTMVRDDSMVKCVSDADDVGDSITTVHTIKEKL